MHSSRFLRCLVVLAGLCYGLAPSSAHAQDAIFADSYELPFNFPANDAEAARFLNQATFGATAADISAVRQQSVAVWLENQLNSGTTTLSRAWLEAYAASLPANNAVSQDDRLQRWYNVAVTSPDQVRQRAAWALGQIVIASDRDAFLVDRPIQMAEWNDIIVRNALGNYRTLMQEVTYSPMMGRYLTTLRNRKFELVRGGTAQNPTFTVGNNGVQPDENYAREVMQLFSIGLLVRGNDFFTTFPDPTNPNPGALRTTYTEEDISGLARFFTGLSHGCTQGASVVGGVTINRNCGNNDQTACTGIACRYTASNRLFNNDPPGDILANGRGLEHPDWYRPMVCYPRYNDNGRDTSGALLEVDSGTYNLPPGTPTPDKTLVLGANGPDATLTVPASSLSSVPLNCHQTAVNDGNPDLSTSLSPAEQQACITYCESNINATLDLLFNHPNTPVLVSRQMIQRLVTSNPTPAYVERVAAAFINNGNNVRGDMKAVVRAILLDAEARRPFNDPATDANFGKVREPMLKQIALWRHFGAISPNTATFPGTNPQGGAANPLGGQPAMRRWGSNSPQDIFQQRPLGAPSVFNFYEPDYKQPGQVAQANLFSPELQIIHEVTAVTASNELFSRICNGYNNCSTGIVAVPAAGDGNSRAYFPQAAVDAVPAILPNAANIGPPALADDMALINFFNTRLMGGTMSGADITGSFNCLTSQPGMKWLVMNALRCTGGINEVLISGITGTNQAERERRKALYVLHLIAISPEYSTQR
jgi:uncharacterized protein (DUF1800 family)